MSRAVLSRDSRNMAIFRWHLICLFVASLELSSALNVLPSVRHFSCSTPQIEISKKILVSNEYSPTRKSYFESHQSHTADRFKEKMGPVRRRNCHVLGINMQAGDMPVPSGSSSFLSAFYKFTRPHTIRGTILASCACVTRVTLDCIQVQSVIEWRLLRIAWYSCIFLYIFYLLFSILVD